MSFNTNLALEIEKKMKALVEKCRSDLALLLKTNSTLANTRQCHCARTKTPPICDGSHASK